MPKGRKALTTKTIDRLSLLSDQAVSPELKKNSAYERSLDFDKYNKPFFHEAPHRISKLAYSPNGKILATAHGDIVRLRDTSSGKLLEKNLKGHEASIEALVFSPNGNIIATSDYQTIILWDVVTGKRLKILSDEESIGGSSALAFSPDSKVIAAGSWDDTIRLLDVTTGNTLKTLKDHKGELKALVFSPDGKMIASGWEDSTIHRWDVSTGTHLKTLEGHKDAIGALAFSPDGKILASESKYGTIQFWDSSTGTYIKTLQGHETLPAVVRAGLAFSPDGKILASGSSAGVRIWNPSTNKLLQILEGGPSLAFSPDGKVLASTNNRSEITFWDMHSTSEPLQLLPDNTLGKTLYPALALAFSPDNKVLASTSNNDSNHEYTIRLWDISNGSIQKILKGPKDPIDALAYKPKENVITSSSYDDLRLWNITTGGSQKILNDNRTNIGGPFAFSPNGSVIATANDKRLENDLRTEHTIQLWDSASGESIKTLNSIYCLQSSIRDIAYSPDGKIIASGCSRNSALFLWDITTGEIIKELQLQAPNGVWGDIQGIAYSPDGSVIAATLSTGLWLWNTKTGDNLLQAPLEHLEKIVYSPDGEIIATLDSNIIRLLDAKTGKTLQSFPASGGALAYSSDGKMIASLSKEGDAIQIWETSHINGALRVLYDFDSAIVSDALGFLWELRVDGFEAKQAEYVIQVESGNKSILKNPYIFKYDGFYTGQYIHTTRTDEQIIKFQSLLEMPLPGESKLQQVVRFLEAECAYKDPKQKAECKAKKP